MNVQAKLKSNNNPQSQQYLFNNQVISKEYYKLFKKKKSKGDSELNIGIGQQNQEKVLKWFFSLDIGMRIKLCSIHNKHLVNILNQLYLHTFQDTRVKFQIRSDDVQEQQYLPSIIYNNNRNAASYINVNINNFGNFTKSFDGQNLNNYLNYFIPSNVETKMILNNYLKENETMEKEILKEIKFFKCVEQNDTFVLSLKLLKNESLFKKYFGYFSNQKYFNSLIIPTQDQITKQYSLHLPEWVNFKDYYSFFQLVIAYFEQSILVWYYFSKVLDTKLFSNLIQSLIYMNRISNLLEESENVVNFLKNEMKRNKEKKKLLEEINFSEISTLLKKDHLVAEAISLNKRLTEFVYYNCLNNRYFFPIHYERKTPTEILECVEHYIQTQFYTLEEENFVELLLFAEIDSIFSYEDFFCKKLWDEIHNLYTKQNALDLINDEFFYETKSKSNGNGRKNSHFASPKNSILPPVKKKKKNKKMKKYEKEESSPTNSSDETKKRTTIKEDFLRNEQNEEYIKSLLQDLILAALKQHSIKKHIKENETDADTAYSSSHLSDEKYKTLNITNKAFKKRNKSNTVFLYTKNPIHIENINKKKNKHLSSEDPAKESNSKILIDENLSVNSEAQLLNMKETENKINIESKGKNDEKIINSRNSITPVPSPKNDKLNKTISQNYSTIIENNNINITINNPVYNNYSILSNAPLSRVNNFNNRGMPSLNYNSYYTKPNYNTTNSFSNNTNINPSSILQTKNFLIDDYQSPFNNPRILNSNIQKRFSTSQNFDNHNYNKYNHHNLIHNEILSYSFEVHETVTALKDVKLLIIKKIENIIKESLSDYNIELCLYGSFATDLEIESSDIDITIKYQSKLEKEIDNTNTGNILMNFNCDTGIIINRLVTTFKNKNIFEINPIYTASVPVIKLQVDLTSLADEDSKKKIEKFKTSHNYKNYRFNYEELNKVKIDLTFFHANKKNGGFLHDSPSQKVVEYVKNSVLSFPEVKPLIHVLKRFLQVEKLNSSFNGGLSSYSLFLILFAFLKIRKFNVNMNYQIDTNLALLLMEFFDFYANFNFNFTFIDVNSSNPFIISNHMLEQIPLILDPITFLNPGKSTYRIEEIKQSFLRTSNNIYRRLFNSNYFNEPNSNFIYSLFDNQQETQKNKQLKNN